MMGRIEKLGKLSLAILENFVGKTLGEDFVEELKGAYQQYETLIEALAKTEDRFISEYPDKGLSKSLFVDLSQRDRPVFREVVQKFYSHPTDPSFPATISSILFDEFITLDQKQIDTAVNTYVEILTEELALVDESFRDNIRGLADIRGEKSQKEMVFILRRVEKLLAERPSIYTEEKSAIHKEQSALSAITLNLAEWKNLAETIGDGKFPDRLLHDQDFEKSDKPFSLLGDQITTSLEVGLLIDVYDNETQTSLKITNASEFWLLLLSTLVIDSKRTGPCSWLIRETVTRLRAHNISPESTMHKLWSFICKRYCNQMSSYHRPNLIDFISETAINTAGRNYEFIFLFFTFLYDQLASDATSIRKIADYLENYDEQLGNDASPRYLERIKYLTGIGKGMAMQNMADIPNFKPTLALIPSNKWIDYEFEAMTHTITIYDYSTIRRVLPQKLKDNPANPYTFNIVSDEGESLFNLLAGEVNAIIKLCQRTEIGDDYEWDIPTLLEWLSLADCIEQPYPWGHDLPTPTHANLDFGAPSRIRPVGSFPLGASKYGVEDCCGNVHEIVRLSSNEGFPNDYRLAGGCYQTSHHHASCRVLRAFIPKPDDNRRNVGARLVRYKKVNREKRFILLGRFLTAQHKIRIVTPE